MNHNALLRKWIKKLHLQDWKIELRENSTPSDFVDDNNCGECEWQETEKSAIIRILNPIYYGERIIPFNFERILVHELLHIKFCLLWDSGNKLQDRIVHQLIADLAKVFVEGDKK